MVRSPCGRTRHDRRVDRGPVALRRRAARSGAGVRARRGRPRRRRGQASHFGAAPLPQWKRAEILDTAARAARRTGRGVRGASIAGEAAKPIKTARVEAQRAVSTFTFAAVAARTLAGDVVPMDASAAGRGQARVHAARADRRRRRDQPVQLPAQPRRAQARAGDRGGVPGRAQAREPDAALGDHARARCCSTSAGCRPVSCTSSPAAAAPSATRSSTTTTSR